MGLHIWSIVIALYLVSGFPPAFADVVRVDYEGFTIWLNCDKRGAVKFRYNAQRD